MPLVSPAARRLTGRALALLAALAVPVYPCGGPAFYPIDAPLATADVTLQAVEVTDDYDFRLRSELRFLYPYLLAAPTEASGMWTFSYADARWNQPRALDTTAVLTLDPVVAAWREAAGSGDRARLERAARAVVEGALALPATAADEYQPVVRRAVEALELLAASGVRGGEAREAAWQGVELSPAVIRTLYGRDSVDAAAARALPEWGRRVLALRATPRAALEAWADAHPGSPREGSLRFVGLQLAMQRGIPDGWARETRDSVPAERWRELAAAHDRWAERFPTHPLAPWVALSRVRLAYFAGDTAAAWRGALALYPTHRWRALDEMRYLLRQGMYPPTLDDPRIDDLLRTALLSEVRIDGARWQREWERARRSDAPWAIAARERLMWRAAQDSAGALALPAEALRVPAASLTPLGGTFRLVALVRGGRVGEAIAYADSLGGAGDVVGDSLLAPVALQLRLADRRWRSALATPHVAREARQYLVRVLAPDSVLRALATGGDALLSREAARTLAMREAAGGAWGAGARALPAADASRAALWRRTAALARDSSLAGRLAYARHLRAMNGRLFWGNDKTWYRSLNGRLRTVQDTVYGGFNPILPWRASDEVAAIARHFREGFEMHHAVRAYVDFLQRAPRSDPRRAAAVREANLAYNWLVNWDNNNSGFWQEELERAGVGRAIRAAGRR